MIEGKREIDEHLRQQADVVASCNDPKRITAAARNGSRANQFNLPLIHRAGKRRGTIDDIFKERALLPPSQQTNAGRNRDADSAVYFFYGADAYGRGAVAFIFSPTIAESDESEFSPFDSGSLGTFCDNPDRSESVADFLEEHTFDGRDVNKFAWYYLNANFRDISDYVTFPQESSTDWPPYHGVQSERTDRRAWTIEVRVYDRVPFEKLERIVIEKEDILLYSEFLHTDDLRIVVVAEDVPKFRNGRDTVAAAIADFVMNSRQELFPAASPTEAGT